MKNYLNPQQVDTLRQYGITFPESYMVTILNPDSLHFNKVIPRFMAIYMYGDVMYWGKNWQENFTSAPCLSEVISELKDMGATLQISSILKRYSFTLDIETTIQELVENFRRVSLPFNIK